MTISSILAGGLVAATFAMLPAPANDYPEYCGDAALAEMEYLDPAEDLAAGKRCAARHIISAMDQGQIIFEDWTWKGAPAVVGEFNDALLEDKDMMGVWPKDDYAWLQSVADGSLSLPQCIPGSLRDPLDGACEPPLGQ